mgnify:CR=1 FL=1
MRMGIAFGRPAMRRPTCVPDPDRPLERLRSQFARQVVELALGSPPIEPLAGQRGDSGAVIASIFEPPQRIHEPVGDRLDPDNSNDTAHAAAPYFWSLMALNRAFSALP